MAPIVFGYWNFRGLAESIVYLLRHVEADFTEKRYIIGPAPDFNKEGWFSEKYHLGLSFPNLPYIIDGDVKLTQSVTILRYLARKYNLAGKNEEEVTSIDLVEQQLKDLQMGLIQISYSPAYEAARNAYLLILPERLELLSKYLSDNQWLVGDDVTYVDFLAYEALDHNRMFAPDLFSQFPNLIQFLKRVESLPNINKYLTSDKYRKWPIYAGMALFGGTGDIPQ